MSINYDLAILTGACTLFSVFLKGVIPNISPLAAIVNGVALPLFAILLLKLVPYLSERHPGQNLVTLCAAIVFTPALFTFSLLKFSGNEIEALPLILHTIISFVFFVMLGSFFIVKAYDHAHGHAHRQGKCGHIR